MSTLRSGARTIADDYPEVWVAYSSPGAANSAADRVSERRRRAGRIRDVVARS